VTARAIEPSETALLVMDYQPAVLAAHAETGPLLDRVADGVSRARAAGLTIGHVWVAFTEHDYAAIPTRANFARVAESRRLGIDDPDSAIAAELAPQPGDVVVRKTRIGAFSTTDLHRQLSQRGITTLVLAGIRTSGVVLTTIREAADLDYRLFVLSDGCDDPDPAVHEVLLRKVYRSQATVLTIAEFAELLSTP
jgi:nicotinamidase-related amidase